MRSSAPLTDSRLRALKPGATRLYVPDVGQPGLVHVLNPSGHRFWMLRFTSPATGKRAVITIGRWPDVTLAMARAKATELRGQIAMGKDPLVERQREEAEALTLADAVEEWDRARADTRAGKTRQMAIGRLRNHVLPKLGTHRVAQITRDDVRRAIDAVEGTETKHRVYLALASVWERLMVAGTVPSNIVRPLASRYPASTHVHRSAIVDPAEFGALLRALDNYSGNATTRYALQLLALVFVRSQELRGATWAEIDLEGAVWTIPAARMKVRANGAHVVPLCPQAVTILEDLHAITYRGPQSLVFAGQRHGRPLSDATLNQALKTLGYGSDRHQPHGFRTTASTMLNIEAARSRRWNSEHIEAQLAHRPADAVRDAYMRADWLEHRREMMKWWGDECDRMRGLAA